MPARIAVTPCPVPALTATVTFLTLAQMLWIVSVAVAVAIAFLRRVAHAMITAPFGFACPSARTQRLTIEAHLRTVALVTVTLCCSIAGPMAMTGIVYNSELGSIAEDVNLTRE